MVRRTAVDLVAVVSAVISTIAAHPRLNTPAIVTVELRRLTLYSYIQHHIDISFSILTTFLNAPSRETESLTVNRELCNFHLQGTAADLSPSYSALIITNK